MSRNAKGTPGYSLPRVDRDRTEAYWTIDRRVIALVKERAAAAGVSPSVYAETCIEVADEAVVRRALAATTPSARPRSSP